MKAFVDGNYKKHMFAHYPLNFEYYGDDIENGKILDVPDLTQNVEKDILAEELKMSCTNIMLQCLPFLPGKSEVTNTSFLFYQFGITAV